MVPVTVLSPEMLEELMNELGLEHVDEPQATRSA